MQSFRESATIICRPNESGTQYITCSQKPHPYLSQKQYRVSNGRKKPYAFSLTYNCYIMQQKTTTALNLAFIFGEDYIKIMHSILDILWK